MYYLFLNKQAALQIAGKAVFEHAILKEDDRRIGSNKNKLQAEENSLIVSPNPASDYTTIQYAMTEKMENPYIVLYDVLGNQVQSVKINSQTGVITLNLNGLSKGLYSCRLINNNKSKIACKVAVIK